MTEEHLVSALIVFPTVSRQNGLLHHFSFIPDFEELEKMVKHLEEETKNLREQLTQRKQVMVVLMSDHEVKLSDQKKFMELKQESWKMERNNFVKQLSDLKKSMELKEESWMMERRDLKEQFEEQLHGHKMSMELKEESWKRELKHLEEELEKQHNEQNQEESWKKEESKLHKQYEKLLQENSSNMEKISAYQQLYSKVIKTLFQIVSDFEVSLLWSFVIINWAFRIT